MGVTGIRSTKGETYPKRTVHTNDIPKILEESPLHSSSFFGLNIPLVSLNGSTLSPIGIGGGEGGPVGLRNVPKIQDGFIGPGISLIAENFLLLPRET